MPSGLTICVLVFISVSGHLLSTLFSLSIFVHQSRTHCRCSACLAELPEDPLVLRLSSRTSLLACCDILHLV